MTHQVQFPNLGISVEVNPIAFQVGNFTIYWYGIETFTRSLTEGGGSP